MSRPANTPLIFSDVCIQAALLARGDWMGVDELMIDYEYIARSTPSFDSLSFGIARLVANGLVQVRDEPSESFMMRATQRTFRTATPGVGVIDFAIQLAHELGVTLDENREEDRSHGRVDGLTYTEYQKAAGAGGEWKHLVDSRLPGARGRDGRPREG